MNTRKGFIRDGFGLAAILAAQSAPAILVRSMVAARGSFLGRGGAKVPTAADYVQDGLYLHLDGLENVGYGQHSDSTDTWVDLSSSFGDFTIGDTAHFQGDCLVNTGGGYAAVKGSVNYTRPARTYEFVVSIGSFSSETFLKFGRFGLVLINKDGRLAERYSAGNVGYSFSPKGLTSFAENTRYTLSVCIASSVDPKKVYCNGVRMDEFSETTRFATPTASQNILDGSGEICDVRWYSRFLTDDEIAYNHSIDKARFNLA